MCQPQEITWNICCQVMMVLRLQLHRERLMQILVLWKGNSLRLKLHWSINTNDAYMFSIQIAHKQLLVADSYLNIPSLFQTHYQFCPPSPISFQIVRQKTVGSKKQLGPVFLVLTNEILQEIYKVKSLNVSSRFQSNIAYPSPAKSANPIWRKINVNWLLFSKYGTNKLTMFIRGWPIAMIALNTEENIRNRFNTFRWESLLVCNNHGDAKNIKR